MLLGLLVLLQDPEALVRDLADPALEVRAEATAALRRLGARADDALERALAHADAEVRARALDLLVERLEELAPERVGRQPRLREARLRRDAMAILARLPPTLVLRPGTRREMLQRHPDLRALRDLGRDIVPILLEELDGRPAIVVALGLFDDPRAAEALDRIAAAGEHVILPGR